VDSVGEPRATRETLFNLEVEISHTYFVSNGSVSVLVHNGYDCLRLPAYEQELVEEGGLTLRGANQIGAADTQLHHIATIYEGEGQWATKFEDLFNKAGYTLEDEINKVMVSGHFGGHPELYHELVFKELTDATAGLSGDTYRAAFQNVMGVLRGRVTDVTDILNALITH
jgi:hypothetical protein